MRDGQGMLAGDSTGAAFVGREMELGEILGLLGAARLLTLTGPGGAGKTRLALAAAQRVGSEAFVVPLADLHSGELVLGATLDAVGAHERPGQERLETLLELLAERDALLVIDNCEHLPAAVAQLIESLLRRTTRLRLLATSRRPLEVAGEVTWRTPPLSLPTDDGKEAVVTSDAGRLFVERARGLSLDAASAAQVAHLCRELDGQPLALELAAARAPTTPLAQIIDGLDDRLGLLARDSEGAPPRHQAVRASLDWSYGLLAERERVALRALSVFAGFNVEAAREVAGVEQASLEQLIRAGLIAVSGERYALPETVRQYALERAATSGELEVVRGRHLDHFCGLARAADELLDRQDGPELLRREAPNVLAALDWALEREDSRALEIAAGLGLWWQVRDRFAEGRAACARVVSVLGGRDPALEALARWASAQLAFLALDLADAHEQGALALALAESSGDARALGRCLHMMSGVLGAVEPLKGLEMGQRAVELLRGVGDRHGLAGALIGLATAAGQCDRFELARAACAEFEALGAGRGHRWLRTWMEFTLAWADDCEGYEPQALAHSDMALELAGGQPTLVRYYALFTRVRALARSGRAEAARAEASAAVRTITDEGLEVVMAPLQFCLAVAEVALGQLDAARVRVAPLIDERHLPGASSVHELLAVITLASGAPDAVGEHVAALRRIGVHSGSERRVGLADLFEGVAALQRGSQARAGALMHAALARLLEHGFRSDATRALEALGALAASEGDAAAAGRLFAAAMASDRMRGAVRVPPDEEWLASIRAEARTELDSEAWELAWADGDALSLEDAAAYAARGRGKRLRPLGGWESLTPTEAEVARLAAAGLSNPQIGERMFISRGTVKAHLSHIYGKLGVTNRTELASAAARREPA